MKAFILVDIRTGEIGEVVKTLKSLDGIIEAHMTFGPYDAVAVVEARSVKEIGKIMSTRIQPIPGVRETLTCLAIDS
jgi:DNA-binding Lrp family transcriptional regulator